MLSIAHACMKRTRDMLIRKYTCSIYRAFLPSLPRGALCNLYYSSLFILFTVVLVTETVLQFNSLLCFLFFAEEIGGGLHYHDYQKGTFPYFC